MNSIYSNGSYDLWLQGRLVLLCIDDGPPSVFISGGLESKFNQDEMWQIAVDAIYRCLVCGLISVFRDEPIGEPLRYARLLADVNPSSENNDESWALWHGLSIVVGTNQCIELMKKHGLNPLGDDALNKVNDAFIAEVLDIFASHGVPLCDEPLVRIKAHSRKPASHPDLN